MRMKNFARSLATDTRGAAGILVGMSLTATVGAAAFAVDIGALYLAERKLQGVADAAAMAAATGNIALDGRGQAQAVIDKSRLADVSIITFDAGAYRQDKSIALENRFDASASSNDAARVLLEQKVPVYFSSILTGKKSGTVQVISIASRQDVAAYTLGSALATVSGGIANELLSEMAGTQLNLSVMDTRGLANAEVDLLGYADALRAQVGGEETTYFETFNSEVPLDDAIAAMAASVDDSGLAELLNTIAGQVDSTGITLSEIIDLGPLGNTDVNDGRSGVSVNAYPLLRTLLELSLGRTYEVDLDLSVAGLSDVSVKVVGGSDVRSSPWLTVTQAKDYVLQTSQARVFMDTQVHTPGVAGARVRLPFYVELASAEARMSSITCTGDESIDGVTMAVTPSVGTLAIADVDTSNLDDLSSSPAMQPVSLAHLASADVTGFAKIELGGVSPQSVRFSYSDIRGRVTKTVSTNDLAQAIASSLAEEMELEVTAGPLGINVDALSSLVGTTLASVAPTLDDVLFETTEALGAKIGAADVSVKMARCGMANLVA